jgi:hypothetical protein
VLVIRVQTVILLVLNVAVLLIRNVLRAHLAILFKVELIVWPIA